MQVELYLHVFTAYLIKYGDCFIFFGEHIKEKVGREGIEKEVKRRMRWSKGRKQENRMEIL
jgi:hypothetical protein